MTEEDADWLKERKEDLESVIIIIIIIIISYSNYYLYEKIL